MTIYTVEMEVINRIKVKVDADSIEEAMGKAEDICSCEYDECCALGILEVKEIEDAIL